MQHIIERYLGSTQYIESGNQHYYYCPKCNWKNPRLSVNYDMNAYHCWYCNFSGRSLLYLLYYVNADDADIQEYKKIMGEEKILESTDGSISKIKQEIYDIIDQRNKDRFKPAGIQPKDHWKPLYKCKGDLFGMKAYKYVRRRGLSPYEIKFYNIMFDMEQDNLILPSYNNQGLMNYYVEHNFLTSFYMNPDEQNKKDIVFFESYTNFKEPIIITEGVYDAIKIGYNAVPMLGKLLHNPLLKKLVDNDTPLVYIFLDGDATDGAYNLYEYLREYSINTKVVETPHDKDANDLPREQIQDLLINSKKYNFKDLITYKLS